MVGIFSQIIIDAKIHNVFRICEHFYKVLVTNQIMAL